MPDAAAKMIEECDRPTEQRQGANRRREKGTRYAVDFAADGPGDQPPRQYDQTDQQRYSSQSMENRQGPT